MGVLIVRGMGRRGTMSHNSRGSVHLQTALPNVVHLQGADLYLQGTLPL